MKEIKLKGLGETIYYDRCDNGLDIYVWVNNKVNSIKGTITYKVGAEDIEFTCKKKKCSVYPGTAHYLEHIMCKDENGESLLHEFQKLEAYSNAYTTANRTVFEFVGTTHLLECLSLLLDATQHKVFSQESFETERGPILEEARINLDHIGSTIIQNMNDCLFHHYPSRNSIVGSLVDIKNIKLDDLKLLYQSFYHPQNSFVTVTGNVDPLEIIHFIRENQKKKTFGEYQKPVLKKYREPKSIVDKYREIFANVEVPKVSLCVKIPAKLFEGEDTYTVLSAIQFVLSSNFGVTSILRDELIEKKLLLTLSAYVTLQRDYFLLEVDAKTKYPSEVIPILKDRLQHLEMCSSDIMRKKKSEIANLVLGYEDPEYVNDMISYSLTKFGKLYDNEKSLLEGITMSKIKDIFSKISMKEMSILVVNPKE